jgi:hypothetical protein
MRGSRSGERRSGDVRFLWWFVGGFFLGGEIGCENFHFESNICSPELKTNILKCP